MLKFKANLAKLKKILSVPLCSMDELHGEVEKMLLQEWRTDEDDTEDMRPVDPEEPY